MIVQGVSLSLPGVMLWVPYLEAEDSHETSETKTKQKVRFLKNLQKEEYKINKIKNRIHSPKHIHTNLLYCGRWKIGMIDE